MSGGGSLEYRYTVARILRSLSEYSGTDLLLRKSIDLLHELPDEEARPLVEAAALLANDIPRMGALVAFEVVAATARAMAREITR